MSAIMAQNPSGPRSKYREEPEQKREIRREDRAGSAPSIIVMTIKGGAKVASAGSPRNGGGEHRDKHHKRCDAGVHCWVWATLAGGRRRFRPA